MTKVDKLASFINSDGCTRIAFLTGAGVSVSAGIPDFRSPGGMYDTLRPDLLTASKEDREELARDPTYVVSLPLFKHNQFCYLEVFINNKFVVPRIFLHMYLLTTLAVKKTLYSWSS